MATITLYANKANKMSDLLGDARSSVGSFRDGLSSLISSAVQIDSGVCSLQATIDSLRSSTDIQEAKLSALESIRNDTEEFIEEVVSIDEAAAEAINKSKNDFYDEYYYLKPESEKSGWEKFKDGLKKAGEWCKDHWKLIVTAVIVIAAVVCLFVPGVNAAIAGLLFGKIILGAAAGALMGAISGGLLGGAMSALSGGSFFEGFEDGAFSGAITGALTGAIGGAGSLAGNVLGKSCAFVEKFGNAIKWTSRISTGLSTAMGLYDSAAMAVGLFAPDCDFVKFNQSLHESRLYNGIQFAAGAVATFTGGMRQGMSEVTPACFIAGTMIAAASGLTAIERIKAGDRVLAADPETLKVSEKSVLETYVREVEQLVHITVGGEEIVTTVDHPFYVRSYGFMVASKLRKGDRLITVSGGELIIEDVKFEHTDEPVKVYNFQVEELHTYHVGSSSILVHNAGENYGKPTEPYNRKKHYGNTPSKSDRQVIGGSPDHDPPLVQRYYEGDPSIGEKPGYMMTPEERLASARDRSRMKPSTREAQNAQGGKMSQYSKEMKKKYGL